MALKVICECDECLGQGLIISIDPSDRGVVCLTCEGSGEVGHEEIYDTKEEALEDYPELKRIENIQS
jgi:DnaJ-class molecular chaperone